MKREIITTADGSKTIQLPEWNEHYHSKHGAIQEARHVFLAMGLAHCISQPWFETIERFQLLEIGFGTGLNALLTAIAAAEEKITMDYQGIEAFPVSETEWKAVDYTEQLGADHAPLFKRMHLTEWGAWHSMNAHFRLKKRQQTFETITDEGQFDLIYFDAFGARVQPELWTEAIFECMYRALKAQGVLVTYAAKGSVRRAMQAVGFTVERLPGPPGKREMLRASKG